MDRHDEILASAADRGVAVTVNMPLAKGRLPQFVGDRPLPDFAGEWGVNDDGHD